MTHIKETLLNMLPGRRSASSEAAIVRLLQGSRRPETRVEQLAVTLLASKGAIALDALAERVASELYREELRNGAGVLDIGLFGSRFFTRDVVRELKAGDGIMWEIKEERQSV
jgi:hypothetical protein